MKKPIRRKQLPQYDFGGWLKEHAGTIGQVAGFGLGAALAPFTGGASLLAAGAAGSQLGGAVGGAVQQEDMASKQQGVQDQMLRQQQSLNANQKFQANNQIRPNIPTFCKGGKTMKKRKYPDGGTNPLIPQATPLALDTTIVDTLSPARSELMKYGDVNNPQMFADLKSLQQSGEDINPKLGAYFSALKGDNTTVTPHTTAFLDNINKNFGTTSGIYYDPNSPSFNVVDKDRYPEKYNTLKSKYVQPNANSVAGKRLQSSGSMGVGTATYAKGGYIADSNMTANSELEDEEVFRTPQGGMFQLNGATHAEGGIPMNLPQGTEILGKNKIPGTNKSFKEYGAKLMKDYNKYTKILDNKPTGLARKTAERMIDNINNDYTNTMALQESLKSVANNTAKYPDGGVQDEQIQLQDWMLDPRKGWGTQNAMNPFISDMQRYGSNKVSTQPRSFNGEAVMGQIMDYAPIAYNLAQGIFNKPQSLKASDYYNPNENQATNLMANRRYNVNPELEANRNAQINYTRALRQGAPSQAQYLGSIQNSQTARSRSDAEAIARKQNMDNAYMGEEAQMRANLGQQKAATNLTIQDINDKNKSAARSYIPTALSQLQQANQVNRLMKNMKKTDAQKTKLLQGMFRGYGFNKYFNTEE